jgi:aminoglycoside phosphotransferase (APT) family kinase protein
VRRRRCPNSSSYDAQVLTARLDGGEDLPIFFKNLGASRFPKDEAARRRDRERSVYRELLRAAAAEDLGTARYYGSVWDEAAGRFWLFLEMVDGEELRFRPLDEWFAAAGWLARLQHRFASRRERLAACAYLVRHDADFFLSRAERARRNVAALFPRLSDRLGRVLEGFERRVEVMVGQAPTLVHGHYRACNILRDPRGAPAARLCAVDWEQAAFGSAFYDLAYLTDGFAPPVLGLFIDAYRREAAAAGLAVPRVDEIRTAVICFQLFMPLHLLSRARERGLASEQAAKAVARLERVKDEA